MSNDHTMKFQFNDDSQEQKVNEILHSVYESLEEKGIIRLTKLSVICCQVIQHTSLVIEMLEI